MANKSDTEAEISAMSNKMKKFKELLDNIESLEDKKKALWLEIYENAITDRMNSHTLFIELHDVVANDPTQHAIQGPQLAKYIERMSRSTDQLIKLAELIAEAEKKAGEINGEEIFSSTKKGR